jgi:shikimate kinase
MSPRTRIILLVGPKGSGKTTLGRVLERQPGVHFLEVEAIARRILADLGGKIDESYARRAFDAVVEGVNEVASEHRAVVIETTGASDATDHFIESLRSRHDVKLVRVRAGRECCERRIAERDSSRQVAVPPELVRAMHERTERLQLPWDVEVQNDPPLDEAAILTALRVVLPPAR